MARASLIFLGLLIAVLVTAASAQEFSAVYKFDSHPGDPIQPGSPGIIAQGRDGNLYSTSPLGGANTLGTAFKLTPAGKLTVIYDFNIPHGGGPVGGLTLASDGNFYGTTFGENGENGTIFKLTPSGVLTALHTFANTGDGSAPTAPPIEADGKLYGTTELGGAWGTIYRLTAAGQLSTLYQFDFTHGALPVAPLVQGTDGSFYGTAGAGGASNDGVIFRVSSSGKFTVLHEFSGADGSVPVAALVEGPDGNFYGTTAEGGSAGAGVVFKIAPSGVYTLLHDFDGAADGYVLYAGLLLATDGSLYGVSNYGGANANCFGGDGTLFKITPQGKFSVIYNFDSTNGRIPDVTLLQHTNGILYGDTNEGGFGGCFGDGVFYSWNDDLPPYAGLLPYAGRVGKTVEVFGQGFSGATGVFFHGTPAVFKVVSGTYLTAKVPDGATTGAVEVNMPAGSLVSNKPFRVTPQILSFDPPGGPIGTTVTITGISLTQTKRVGFGNPVRAQFTVNSDKQVTAVVPAGAKTGKIGIETVGGIALSSNTFTVNKHAQMVPLLPGTRMVTSVPASSSNTCYTVFDAFARFARQCGGSSVEPDSSPLFPARRSVQRQI